MGAEIIIAEIKMSPTWYFWPMRVIAAIPPLEIASETFNPESTSERSQIPLTHSSSFCIFLSPQSEFFSIQLREEATRRYFDERVSEGGAHGRRGDHLD
jgi:hypothetical protein